MLPKELPVYREVKIITLQDSVAEHAIGEDGIETEKVPQGKWYSNGLSKNQQMFAKEGGGQTLQCTKVVFPSSQNPSLPIVETWEAVFTFFTLDTSLIKWEMVMPPSQLLWLLRNDNVMIVVPGIYGVVHEAELLSWPLGNWGVGHRGSSLGYA